MQNGWTQWLKELLPILLNIIKEQKEKIKHLTQVLTMDQQHEKITKKAVVHHANTTPSTCTKKPK
jgi:hypothetical protein